MNVSGIDIRGRMTETEEESDDWFKLINDYGNIDFESSNIRKYWQPTFVIDYWNFPNKDTFITQHSSLKGMSGGPVFDVKGNVCGMDRAHMIRKIEIPNQKSDSVSNGVVITVEELKKVIEKYKKE